MSYIAVSAQEMRELDRRAQEEFGIPGLILMESAGRAVAEAVICRKPNPSNRVAVFCGSGNNGGDGLVAARYLWNQGYRVTVFLVKDPGCFKGDALVNWNIVEKSGISVVPFTPSLSLKEFTIAIDALLGTGLNKNVSGTYADAIRKLNKSGLLIFSVDVPSGLDADTGLPRRAAIKATVTVTLALPKTGMLNYCAIPYVGMMSIVDIGLPRILMQTETKGKKRKKTMLEKAQEIL